MTLVHDNCYTRIQLSLIHGVGVFAIKDIPKGIFIFGEEDEKFVKVLKSDIFDLDYEVKRLYKDFCVLENGYYYCPISFNRMDSSWYLNHSENPNVDCKKDGYLFYSLRDIKKGEELTVNYDKYSE